MRVKLDYNHLMEELCEFLDSKEEGNGFFPYALTVGLELLNSYIKNIAERAIEINDAVLIDLLKDLCVLKEEEGAG